MRTYVYGTIIGIVLLFSFLSQSLLAADEMALEGLMEEYSAEAEEKKVHDPFYFYNYAVYKFNDKFYFCVLKPLAKGYKTIVPGDARICIRNFFYNMLFPVRLINTLLQGKLPEAGVEIGTFVINSTVGCFGFGTPAQDGLGLETSDEDFGQTLGAYSFPEGVYIVWPFLGPSTLKDTIGMTGDYFITPLNYLEPATAAYGTKALDVVNATSFRLGDYETLKAGAVDPYTAIKNGYIQSRRKKTAQ